MYISSNPQGSNEWLRERSKIVTASEAYRILPPKKGKNDFLETASTYAAEIVAAHFQDYQQDQPEIPHIYACEWGKYYEPIARELYASRTKTFIEVVGLCKPTENAFYGCSPDGLVFNDGLTEIKCPMLDANHVKYALGDWKKHLNQMQFSLFALERQWCDFISYHPYLIEGAKIFIKRIYADKDLHEVFQKQLYKFERLIEEKKLEFKTNLGIF